MKKTCVLVAVLLFAINTLWAQEGDDSPKQGFQREKMFIGGNFGLTFGDFTLINISPQLGYRFTDFFAAGFGVNGQYISIRQRYIDGSTFSRSSRGVVGLNVFGRVYPIRQLMLQVQPEANYVFGKDKYFDRNPPQVFKSDASIVPSLLLGGGAVIPSGRGAMILSVFYDVLQSENSPYGRRPIYNFGYNIGF
jgi:hypothetical protein